MGTAEYLYAIIDNKYSKMYNYTVGNYIIICIVKSDMYIIGKIIVDSVIEKSIWGNFNE